MAREHPATPSSTAGWEDYVRRAIPVDSDWEAAMLLRSNLCNLKTLPPPPVLPLRSRKGFFSGFVLTDADGAVVPVPQHAVVRNHGEVPPEEACSSWRCELPHVRDIVVLAIRDAIGNLQYGWYVRTSPGTARLARVPVTIIRRIWRYVRETPELKHSSLNEAFVDAAFTSPTVQDFHATALLRFRRSDTVIRNVCLKPKSSAKRKRVVSSPPSPARTLVMGACTVCLDENVELSDRNCCGTQGATCFDCSQKLRSLCPVCDRSFLNATYQCTLCNAEVPLKEYGFPCSTCQQCTLCNNCYHQFAECAECDPVRSAEEAACVY